MRDKITGIILLPLFFIPIAYFVFNIIKIIAIVLFPGQINMPKIYFGDGWAVDLEKDIWGIFIVWIILSIFVVKKIVFNNENKS